MKFRINLLQGFYAVAVICAGAFVIWLAIQGFHAKTALCALQNDLRERVTSTRTFVAENGGKNGYAIQGVSNRTLLSSAASQEKTANVLDNELKCPDQDK